jgi:hypothetical protein
MCNYQCDPHHIICIRLQDCKKNMNTDCLLQAFMLKTKKYAWNLVSFYFSYVSLIEKEVKSLSQ